MNKETLIMFQRVKNLRETMETISNQITDILGKYINGNDEINKFEIEKLEKDLLSLQELSLWAKNK